MIRYINFKGKQGIETVDEINSADYKTHKEFRKDLRSIFANYVQMYGNVWISQRCTKDWND